MVTDSKTSNELQFLTSYKYKLQCASKTRGSHNAVTVYRWNGNKMNLINIGWEGVGWIYLAQDRD